MIKQRERMISFTNNNQLFHSLYTLNIFIHNTKEAGLGLGLGLGLRLRGREPGF